MLIPLIPGQRSLRPRGVASWTMAVITLSSVLSQSATAQNCPGRTGGGAPTAPAGLGSELQAQQFLLQLQQMQEAALQQQAMQRMRLTQQQASASQRARRCDMPGSDGQNRTEGDAIRETGDRFATQREHARLRREALVARIAERDADLQRRRDRAAAGR